MPGSLLVEFKEEQATGAGVLRAWFLLVSQEIFNPNNVLLVASTSSDIYVEDWKTHTDYHGSEESDLQIS
ncbi:hypothetical protein EJD97_007829, partial [Solanum chilense]